MQVLEKEKSVVSPFNDEIEIRVLTTLAEAHRALRFYADIAVVENPFISQMGIDSQTFYEEGLSYIA